MLGIYFRICWRVRDEAEESQVRLGDELGHMSPPQRERADERTAAHLRRSGQAEPAHVHSAARAQIAQEVHHRQLLAVARVRQDSARQVHASTLSHPHWLARHRLARRQRHLLVRGERAERRHVDRQDRALSQPNRQHARRRRPCRRHAQVQVSLRRLDRRQLLARSPQALARAQAPQGNP